MNDRNYIEHFNQIFGTNIVEKINNMSLLERLFEYFEEDLYTPSKENEILQEKRREISQKLETTFNEEQQELFEEYWEASNNLETEEQQQLFIFGYLVARELLKEGKNNNCQNHQDLTEEK